MCEFVCAHKSAWLSAEGSVCRNSCDSAPWGETSSFPCKHNQFSRWQSHEPPQSAVLQDIDRKLRQAMAHSPVLDAGECKRVNEGRERERMDYVFAADCSNTVKSCISFYLSSSPTPSFSLSHLSPLQISLHPFSIPLPTPSFHLSTSLSPFIVLSLCCSLAFSAICIVDYFVRTFFFLTLWLTGELSLVSML